MAWTTPPTWSPSTIVPSADLQLVSDDLTYLKTQVDGLATSAVKLSRDASASLTNNTDYVVSWDNERGDLGNWYTSGTDIVMPSDYPSGVTTTLCSVPVVVRFATNATGQRSVSLMQNGSLVQGFAWPAIAADPTVVAVTFVAFEVAEADVLTLVVKQTSGSTINLTAAHICVIRHGPTG